MYASFIGTVFNKEAKKELKQVQTQYAAAKAEYDRLKTIEHEAIDNACKVLNLITEDGEPADHHNDFMLSDTDFNRMLLAAQKLIQAQGIKHDDPELVISHEAWKTLRQAEKDLAAWGAKYVRNQLNIDAKTWERMTTMYPHQDKFIEMTMRLHA